MTVLFSPTVLFLITSCNLVKTRRILVHHKADGKQWQPYARKHSPAIPGKVLPDPAECCGQNGRRARLTQGYLNIVFPVADFTQRK